MKQKAVVFIIAVVIVLATIAAVLLCSGKMFQVYDKDGMVYKNTEIHEQGDD